MKQRDLMCRRLVKKFENAYEEKKHIIIICENNDYSSTVETDELVVIEDGGNIVFDNMEGLNFTIKRNNINMISLSDISDSEEVNIDFGKSNIKLLICN
ncbi:MAG: hypothetical protein K0S41_2075 [Anaerocolumna sp.]|jgi:ABC-type Na+ transport system ATPase subunit NatA|nr:hypothetical protein [Anaerocolumna sp.]